MEILNEALPIGVKVLLILLMGCGVAMMIAIIWACVEKFIDTCKRKPYSEGYDDGYNKGWDDGRERGFNEARQIFRTGDDK